MGNLNGVDRVTDQGARAVTYNCWKLQTLNMMNNYLITDSAFILDTKRDGRRAVDENMMKVLTELNISECSLITDFGIGHISTRCALLKGFHASACPRLTDSAAQSLVCEPSAGDARGAELSVLNLSFCTNLTDQSMELIAKACPKLENVNISGCVHLSDAGIRHLAVNCSHIQIFAISFCKRLTDTSVCTMADFLWLEDLSLEGCRHITDDGIEVLAMEFAGMAHLNISSC